jgi:hypothetical protein
VARLDQDESVEIVAKQLKFRPGGSAVTPNTIFVTNNRESKESAREKVDAISFNQITSIQLGKGVFSSTIKLRAYGYEEDIEAIPKDKAEKIVEHIKEAMRNLSEARSVERSSSIPQQQPSSLSLADELSKLAKLKEQGILSEAEFTQMKQDLIKKMT